MEAADDSSPCAEGEIFMLEILFVNSFFASFFCKEKVAKEFMHCYKLYALVYAPFCLPLVAEQDSDKIIDGAFDIQRSVKANVIDEGGCFAAILSVPCAFC